MGCENEHDSGDLEGTPLLLVTEEQVTGPALRWTPLTIAIDLLGATSEVLDAVSGFFVRQAESVAAKASLREDMEDRAIRQRLREETRLRMRLDMAEDLASLPGTDTE